MWAEIEGVQPELAARIRLRFESHAHHVVGTVMASGAPRLSGINIFFNDGYLWFGSMPRARKARDLFRDPRVSVYSAPLREDMEGGDASVRGVARPLSTELVMGWRPENPSDGEFFYIDISQLHLVEVVDEQLVITMWDTDTGLRIVNRQ
jgi:hypothetical protein